MKVILKQEVRNLGHEWDVVTVADGYARNYLIPRKIAMPATQSGVKDLERRQQKAAVRRQQEQEVARGVAARIEQIPVAITARAGAEGRLYGSVTPTDIAEFFAAHGIEVDRRRVEIREPIRTVGEHHVNIELYSGVTVHVRVQVNPEGGPPVAPAAESSAAANGAADPGSAMSASGATGASTSGGAGDDGPEHEVDDELDLEDEEG